MSGGRHVESEEGGVKPPVQRGRKDRVAPDPLFRSLRYTPQGNQDDKPMIRRDLRKLARSRGGADLLKQGAEAKSITGVVAEAGLGIEMREFADGGHQFRLKTG